MKNIQVKNCLLATKLVFGGWMVGIKCGFDAVQKQTFPNHSMFIENNF
jgi:hypothetical protein